MTMIARPQRTSPMAAHHEDIRANAAVRKLVSGASEKHPAVDNNTATASFNLRVSAGTTSLPYLHTLSCTKTAPSGVAVTSLRVLPCAGSSQSTLEQSPPPHPQRVRGQLVTGAATRHGVCYSSSPSSSSASSSSASEVSALSMSTSSSSSSSSSLALEAPSCTAKGSSTS